MQIRRATGEEMLKLWGYRDETAAPSTAKFFYRSISTGNTEFWALDHCGELIGELYVFRDIAEDRDFADGTTTAYLCAFRVKNGYRGRGLGSRLMETVLSNLNAEGFRRATIGVSEERNERLYRRLGFTDTVKRCFVDPCAMDEKMRPERDDQGFWLLAKNLSTNR